VSKGSGKWKALYEGFLKKTPKQSRSRALVEVMLSATKEVLARSRDEDEVTVQAVADRAGVGIGSLYDYFADRESLLSGVAAKLTEDNLQNLQRVLAESRDEPVGVAVERVVDHVFATYVRDPAVPRAVLRIAHRIDFMPFLARSQAAFAATLAADLRERKDVNVADADVAAYVLTNATMGLVHTLVWRAEEEPDEATLRRELVRAWTTYLSNG